jgi:hypothetical protein
VDFVDADIQKPRGPAFVFQVRRFVLLIPHGKEDTVLR